MWLQIKNCIKKYSFKDVPVFYHTKK